VEEFPNPSDAEIETWRAIFRSLSSRHQNKYWIDDAEQSSILKCLVKWRKEKQLDPKLANTICRQNLLDFCKYEGRRVHEQYREEFEI
jgi:hypothetical protein